jgi:centrosomal protein CEP135
LIRSRPPLGATAQRRSAFVSSQVYQQLHEREEQLSQELGLAQAQLFPLRKDNARLLRENNELHRDAISQAEACDAKLRDLAVENKRVHSQMDEMRLLQEQAEETIVARSKEVEMLQSKLQAFSEAFDGVDGDLDEPLLAARNDRGPQAFKLARRHQPRSKGSSMMQMTTPLAAKTEGPSQHEPAVMGTEGEQKQTGDDEVASTKVLEALQAQIADLRERLAAAESSKGVAQASVEIREREIKRLGLVLEQGRDYGVMSTDHAHEANRKIIDQLNSQVDFLNHQLAMHEERAAEYDGQQELLERAIAESKVATEKAQIAVAQNNELRTSTARAELAAEKAEQRLRSLEEGIRDGSHVPPPPYPETTALSYGAVGSANAAFGTGSSDGGGDASPDAQRAAQELRERAAGLQRELNDTLKCCEDAERSASVAYDEVNRLRAENETLIRVGEDVRDRLADAAKSAGQDELVRALEAQRNSMLVQADATRSVAEQAKRELAAAREDEGVAKARLNAANDERRRLAAYVETLERRLGDQTTDGLATVAEAEALRKAVTAATSGSAAIAAAGDEAIFKLAREVSVSEGRAQQIAHLTEELENAKDTIKDLEKNLNAVKELLLESDRARGNMSGRLAAAVGLPQALQGLTEELKAALQGKKDLEIEGEHLRAECQRAIAAAARAEMSTEAKVRALAACTNANAELTDKNDELTEQIGQRKMAQRVAQEELRVLKLGRAEMSDAHLATSTSLVSMEATLATQRSELEHLQGQLGAERDALKQCREELGNARREHAVAQEVARGLEDRGSQAAEQLDALTTELSLTRSRLAEVESSCRQREVDLDSMQGVLAQTKAQRDHALMTVETLEEKNEHARRHAARSEQSRLKLVERLDEMTKNNATQSEAQGEWQQERQRLTETLEASRQSEANLRAAVAALDRERDAAAAAADDAAEAATEAEAGREDAQTRLSELARQTAEDRTQTNAFVDALAQRDRELKAARTTADAAAKDATKLKRLLAARMDELRTAADDLGMMTRENQAVHSELAELASFRDSANARMRVAEEARVVAEQRAKMAEAERGDILNNYKKVCGELKAVEARTHDLNHSRQTLARELAERQAEVSRLTSALQATETQLQRRSLDIAALERQIENLSSSHRGVERKLEAADDEARRAIADVAAQRAASGNVDAEIERWQRASAAAAEEASVMRVRLSVLEAERAQMHQTVLQEKQHSSELERIIQTSRMRQSATEGRVQQLIEQKAELESRLYTVQSSEKSTPSTNSSRVVSGAPSPQVSTALPASLSSTAPVGSPAESLSRAASLPATAGAESRSNTDLGNDGGISDLTAR